MDRVRGLDRDDQYLLRANAVGLTGDLVGCHLA